MGRKNYSNVAELEEALMKAWDEIDEETIRRICAAAPRRFEAVVEKEGRHIEKK